MVGIVKFKNYCILELFRSISLAFGVFNAIAPALLSSIMMLVATIFKLSLIYTSLLEDILFFSYLSISTLFLSFQFYFRQQSAHF